MNSPQVLKKQQKIAHLIEKGRLKEAIKPMQQLCKQQPKNTGYWLNLASLYGQTGDFQSVIKVCRKVEPELGDNAMLYSLLGNAHASLGQAGRAHEYYQKALELQPDDVGLLNNLGNALYLENRMDEAAEVFQRVIAIKPDYADAHNNLGNIYKALNDNELAVKHYEHAIKLNPTLGKTCLNLGHMYADRIGHPEIAEQRFRKALELEPDNMEALSGVANMLRYQGRMDEALALIKETRKKRPDDPGLLAGEADVYERTGRHDDAYRVIREAFDKNLVHPMMVDIFLRICHKYDVCDEALTRGEELLKTPGLLSTQKQNTHNAMGKVYDRLENYDRAFEHYRASNEAQDIPFDEDRFEQRVDKLIETYSAESIKRYSSSDIDTRLPIFIVGMPRSSTSLTEQILSSHPEVNGAGELNDINDIAVGMPQRLKTATPYPECIAELDTATANALAGDYMQKLKTLCGEHRHITDKMPHNFLNVGLISLLFPQAKIIHCERDPRDTCLSIYFQNFGWLHPYGTRLEWLGFYYRQYQRVMEHWKSVVNIPIHTVSYDDMVNDQEATTRKMLDYCGLEWDDACLDFHKSKRVVATASYDQVRQKIYTKSQARWKNYEAHIGALLDSLEG